MVAEDKLQFLFSNCEDVALPILSPEDNALHINFRKKHLVNAKKVIKNVFAANRLAENIKDLKEIRVLVPGSGSFPSYVPFTNQLLKSAPGLTKISYTLIDEKNDIDIFKSIQAVENPKLDKNITVVIDSAETQLKAHLANTNRLYHFVYFEHPCVDALTQVWDVLAQRIYGSDSLSIALSLPYLQSKLEKNAVVMAICKSRHEAWQMQSLLKVSLRASSQISLSSKQNVFQAIDNFLIPAEFSNGLAVKPTFFGDARAMNEASFEIHMSELSLAFCLAYTALLYCGTFNEGFTTNTLVFLSAVAHMLMHTPESKSYGVKVGIFVAQLAVAFSMQEETPVYYSQRAFGN
jgi:hypothetical protein